MTSTQHANPPKAHLTFFGRASVKINYDKGPVVYIDPYAGDDEAYAEPADLVLVTHQHGDHNQVGRVMLKPEGKILQCPVDVVPGAVLKSHGLTIHVVDAYNINHKQGESAGFVLEAPDLVIYHSGDTSPIPEMAALKDLHIDYALLCMDGYYNMGPAEAKAAADLFEPKWIVPIHTSKQDLYDQGTVDAFDSEKKVGIKPGERIGLG